MLETHSENGLETMLSWDERLLWKKQIVYQRHYLEEENVIDRIEALQSSCRKNEEVTITTFGAFVPTAKVTL